MYGEFDLCCVHEMGLELVPEPNLQSPLHAGSESVNTSSNARRVIHKAPARLARSAAALAARLRGSRCEPVLQTMTLNSIDCDLLVPELDTPSMLFTDDQEPFRSIDGSILRLT